MLPHPWKYNIGDFVTPIVHDHYEHGTKMVVVAHETAEFADHIERTCLCSHFKLGDYVRTRLLEAEITAWPEEK
jgi:hypothetical protein